MLLLEYRVYNITCSFSKSQYKISLLAAKESYLTLSIKIATSNASKGKKTIFKFTAASSKAS